MKKSTLIGSMSIMALSGYGAWCIYKKMNPKCAHNIKNNMKKATRNVEKSIEDMM